jgi:leukotriene-A4 hydrolase
MNKRDPHSFADTAQGVIKHIDFNIEVNFTEKILETTAYYSLERPVNGSFFLDTRGLEIVSVHDDEKEVLWELDRKDEVKGERLHIRDLKNCKVLKIVFKTGPGATALQWLEPSQTAGKKNPYLFSQCQAIHARSVFPCQDSPGVRFTYTAEVSLPKPLSAVMSAARTDMFEKDGRNVCIFNMPQPIPSYLFALAAGNITGKDLGERSRIYAEPEVVEAAAWEFAETEKMISEAENLFGPYEWDRFDMLVMPPSFPYGGMENPRLTFLTPTLIVGDRSMTNVVAHELAHSWTGNLVTNATWEDFWLNEGWTVYAERRILEVLEGEDFVQLQSQIRQNSMLADMKLFGMESDPTKLKFNQEGVDPDEVFSTIPYEKGFSFIKRVEEITGRDTFNGFIKKYISTFKFKGIGTERFLDFLKENLPGIEDKIDIRKWVYEPGYPEDHPVFQSAMLAEVNSAVDNFAAGILPDKETADKWNAEQKILFLQNIPDTIEIEKCGELYDVFNLAETKNKSILTEFYRIAVLSGYRKVLPEVEALLAEVGRMLYLKPLYRALLEAEWSKPLVREILDKNKAGYHPIAAGGLENILEKAGV